MHNFNSLLIKNSSYKESLSLFYAKITLTLFQIFSVRHLFPSSIYLHWEPSFLWHLPFHYSNSDENVQYGHWDHLIAPHVIYLWDSMTNDLHSHYTMEYGCHRYQIVESLNVNRCHLTKVKLILRALAIEEAMAI